MNYELNIYELGKIVKKLNDIYPLSIMIKKELSGGWLTLTGDAKVSRVPGEGSGCNGKNINILEIEVSTGEGCSSVIKITGAKNKKFKVDVAATRYKELKPSSITLDMIKINNDESKLRIDEDIIFTIKDNCDNISSIIAEFI